jgi:hypothetical protein
MRVDRALVAEMQCHPAWRKPSVETRVRRLLMVARRRASNERRCRACRAGTRNVQSKTYLLQPFVMADAMYMQARRTPVPV